MLSQATMKVNVEGLLHEERPFGLWNGHHVDFGDPV